MTHMRMAPLVAFLDHVSAEDLNEVMRAILDHLIAVHSKLSKLPAVLQLRGGTGAETLRPVGTAAVYQWLHEEFPSIDTTDRMITSLEQVAGHVVGLSELFAAGTGYVTC
jgi:hypothetical protein